MAIGNKTDAQILELKEAQMKTDAQQNRTDVKLKETIKEFRAAQKLLGDLGLVQGEVAEELFYRNVKGLFSPLSLSFDRIRRNVKVKGHRDYDIVADDKKLPRFKTLLPEYQDSKILAGVGALVVKDDVGRYAEKAGLFVLTQTSDGGAAIFNRKGFRPKEFA